MRYAGDALTESVVVFNGDVLTQVDLAAVLTLHRERKARATIVLTPVDNPTAYGLVETDKAGNILRFLEKPKPEEITTNYINAGIYILEPETFDRIPKDTPWSIERSFFPSFIERGETFVAYQYNGYWIDIGTPEKYTQVHRDIMDGRYQAPPFAGQPAGHVFRGRWRPRRRRRGRRGPLLSRCRHGRAGRRVRRAVFGAGPRLRDRGTGARLRQHRLGHGTRRPGSVDDGCHCRPARACRPRRGRSARARCWATRAWSPTTAGSE